MSHIFSNACAPISQRFIPFSQQPSIDHQPDNHRFVFQTSIPSISSAPICPTRSLPKIIPSNQYQFTIQAMHTSFASISKWIQRICGNRDDPWRLSSSYERDYPIITLPIPRLSIKLLVCEKDGTESLHPIKKIARCHQGMKRTRFPIPFVFVRWSPSSLLFKTLNQPIPMNIFSKQTKITRPWLIKQLQSTHKTNTKREALKKQWPAQFVHQRKANR